MMKTTIGANNEENDFPSDKNQRKLYGSNARGYFEMEDLEEDVSPDGEEEVEGNSEKELVRGDNAESGKSCNKQSIVTGSMFVIFVLIALILYFTYQAEIEDNTEAYIEFMKDNSLLGVLIFFMIYTLTIAASIPSTIFLLCGAFIFGKVFGFENGFLIFCLVDYFSLQVGSLLAFWIAYISLYLFKSCTKDCIEGNSKLNAISQALSVNAKKLVALLRICSITPYFILNCVCGITDMATIDFMIGNIPIIIADVPYIYVCASISDVAQVTSSNPLGDWYYVLLSFGLLVIIAVVILIYIFAKRELKNTLKKIKKIRKGGKKDEESN